MPDEAYYTSAEVADLIGVKKRRVNQLAVELGVTMTRHKFYAWTVDEVEQARQRIRP